LTISELCNSVVLIAAPIVGMASNPVTWNNKSPDHEV